jgi:hypothetical protein
MASPAFGPTPGLSGKKETSFEALVSSREENPFTERGRGCQLDILGSPGHLGPLKEGPAVVAEIKVVFAFGAYVSPRKTQVANAADAILYLSQASFAPRDCLVMMAKQ